MEKTGKLKRNDITELVFILDRSGSMGGFEDDTIGGFNSLIEKQKKVDGKALVTTYIESCNQNSSESLFNDMLFLPEAQQPSGGRSQNIQVHRTQDGTRRRPLPLPTGRPSD